MQYNNTINNQLKFSHKRESNPFYIGTTDTRDEMLQTLGMTNLEDLYSHIPSQIRLQNSKIPQPKTYDQTKIEMERLASNNIIKPHFLGDGVFHYKQMEIVSHICSLRNLLTAYTPYQPERSQGTLQTLWIYANQISKLTGFEAINASLYDRASAICEASQCANRLTKKRTVIFLGLLPQDIEVVKTFANGTYFKPVFINVSSKDFLIDKEKLIKILKTNQDISSIVFPQTNSFGFLEDVNFFTDLATKYGLKSIAVLDPILIGKDGLLSPSKYGKNQQGTDMFVAEGLHLATAPNFGGPGLGIFGIRFNQKDKRSIRQTAGRFIGKTVDSKGNSALCMILSTREQHIRREKATSNICSNQSFMATLVGASLLQRGEEGLKIAHQTARKNAKKAFDIFVNYKEFSALSLNFYNEFSLKYTNNSQKNTYNLNDLLNKISVDYQINIGLNITNRMTSQEGYQILKVSLTDMQEDQDFQLLSNALDNFCCKRNKCLEIKLQVPRLLQRNDSPNLTSMNYNNLKQYYQYLDQLNMGSDDNIYPLGSCTMKYNPFLNEYAASLPGIQNIHPSAPLADIQGSLEVLYLIQKYFKDMTNLSAVTTQPVAGAHGEYTALKMFKAYHESKGNTQKDIIIIPSTAHGTNPASASVAGFKIKVLETANDGEINLEELKQTIDSQANNIAGMMVTNPNTSGIFETHFQEIAQMIHNVDGLMYMDGANLNAVSGIIDLNKMGVDAVHVNLHKTFSIPHGGGGPGDAVVIVSDKLTDFLPGLTVHKTTSDSKTSFVTKHAKHSIGSVHRNFGNFAHKVRALTYLKVLGNEGVKLMSSHAVLASNYLLNQIKDKDFKILPQNSNQPHMHEFILSLSEELFNLIENSGIVKSKIIGQVGKIFLDFGVHSPTVSFPEHYGMMIEPTESYSKEELDRFADVIKIIKKIIKEEPQLLRDAPHLTPIYNVDQVRANTKIILSEDILDLEIKQLKSQNFPASELSQLELTDIIKIIKQ